MPTKTRIIIVGILILLGGALFCYFVFFHLTDITTQAKIGSTTVSGSEAAPVKAASTVSVGRDKPGQINQTRSEGKSRPKSGST
jgi:hypothetical protein